MSTDPTDRLDDPDFPALTMSQAAELLGVQPAFLRSLDSSGALEPHRSPGGHRRYSRHQLTLAARLRGLLDDGHPLASADRPPPPGAPRRYSRHQLTLAARLRGLLDDGHPLASAETIVGVQDELASARADADRLRRDAADGGADKP